MIRVIRERRVDTTLTLTAQHLLHPDAEIFQDFTGRWMLALPQGVSEIGDSRENAQAALSLLIESRRRSAPTGEISSPVNTAD